jgi:adenylate kinase family enzyme
MFLPNSIAVGGSDLKRVLNSDYNFVFVFDNEPRNKELLKVMDSMLDYKMVVWPKNIYEKDVNDMILNDREIMNIIDKNTFSGLRLKMALSAWRK